MKTVITTDATRIELIPGAMPWKRIMLFTRDEREANNWRLYTDDHSCSANAVKALFMSHASVLPKSCRDQADENGYICEDERVLWVPSGAALPETFDEYLSFTAGKAYTRKEREMAAFIPA